MTVKELADYLTIKARTDPDMEIILQKDAEGNGYSPLAGFDDNCRYLPDSTYSGEVGLDYLTEGHRKKGYTEEDVGHGNRVIVLFPVN